MNKKPQIQKLVPVKKNGYVLELQVPPPVQQAPQMQYQQTAEPQRIESAQMPMQASIQSVGSLPPNFRERLMATAATTSSSSKGNFRAMEAPSDEEERGFMADIRRNLFGR